MNTETQYRPSLTFYHPNNRGTGGAISMELHPAHEATSGSIMLSAANQLSVGNKTQGGRDYARFDWKGKIVVKLDFNDLSKMLQVFRGEMESLADGKGLYHNSPSSSTRIVLRHLLEPMNGYSFELYRTLKTGEEMNFHIFFNASEALGITEAISGSMAVIAFGIPKVIPHDTSKYREMVKEGSDAPQS